MVLIDERDNMIIEALRRDCRAPNSQIAREVDVSEGTIRRRLNRLLTEGAIEISVTEVAQQAEDKGGDAPAPKEYFIGMKVSVQNMNEAHAEMRKLDKNAAIIAGGAYDIIARVKVEGDELKSLLNDKVRKIEGVEKAEIGVVLLGGESERMAG